MIKGQTSSYGSVKAWIDFQEKILKFSKSNRFIIVTDIANYYDFISYDHMRNILTDLTLVREHSLDLLIDTLSHMLWQPDYMPRVQIGLPQMALDGARMLAHCFLYEIDALLSKQMKLDYARFMDDIDIGVNSVVEAKAVLRDLDLALQTRQIRLNSGKTRIFSAKAARKHFCVVENARLDILEDRIDQLIANANPIKEYQILIRRLITRGLEKDRFAAGNGEKLLKRCINYASKFGANIADDDFARILIEWPSCRETALNWWLRSASPEAKIVLIRNFIASGHVIDDLAYIQLAKALVAARLPANLNVSYIIE